jgi:hypothetical protein
VNRFPVNVTRADIDQGYAPSSTGCPLALAVRRLFPDALVVAVGVHTVGVWSDGEWRDYLLPRGVAKKQMDMIAKRPVEPFQFWLGDDDRIDVLDDRDAITDLLTKYADGGRGDVAAKVNDALGPDVEVPI